MKALSKFLLGVYFTISFLLVLDPLYSYISEDLYRLYRDNMAVFDRAKYINFAFSYVLSIVSFYVSGYEDGKKETFEITNMD